MGEDELFKRMGEGDRLIVKFSADWCVPCRVMTLVAERLAARVTGVEFYEVDVDANARLAEDLTISTIPTFVHFSPDGREVARVAGVMREDELARRLKLRI